MRRFIRVLIIFFGAAAFAGGNITDIKFVGLKRTKLDYLMSRADIKKYIGSPVDYFNKDELITTLHEIGLFTDECSAEIKRIPKELVEGYDDEYEEEDYNDELSDQNADATLIITVKEKWSLIPIPFIAGNNDGILGGAAFMDMNAFGRQYMFVAAGVFSANMQLGAIMLTQPVRSPRIPGFMVNARFSNNMPRFSTYEDDKIYEVDMLKASCGLSLQGLIPGKVKYTVGANFRYTRHWRDGVDDAFNNNLNLGISRKWTTWNGWFLLSSGLSFGGSVGLDWARPQNILGSVSGAANYQFSPGYKRMTIDIALKGEMGFNQPITESLGKGNVGISIMHGDFRTDRAASAKVTWETGLVKIKFMTLSLFASYEFLLTGNVKLDRTTDFPLDIATRNKFLWASGPGIGVKIYLNQIAMPCLMVGYYHNVNQNKPRFGFSIGMSM